MGDHLPLWLEIRERGFRFHFADARLATSARRLFIAYLGSQVSPDCDLFNVELVFGEILGNVACHAPGPVDVGIVWEDAGARLEVWDHGPGYELNVALPDLLEESGRGLFLVAQYTDYLRVERRAGCTVTSVMLHIKPAFSQMNAPNHCAAATIPL
jgi:anti-sigma regulatory factor (Ser/Thr protein kinase)